MRALFVTLIAGVIIMIGMFSIMGIRIFVQVKLAPWYVSSNNSTNPTEFQLKQEACFCPKPINTSALFAAGAFSGVNVSVPRCLNPVGPPNWTTQMGCKWTQRPS